LDYMRRRPEKYMLYAAAGLTLLTFILSLAR
jgi:hypothetical protein